MTEPNDYPNFEPDTLGDSKIATLKRLPEMSRPGRAPRILWGDEYKSWSLEKKVKHLEIFSDSMNEAADIAQTQLFAAWGLGRTKDKQIKQLKEKVAAQDQLLQGQMNRSNGREQELQERIVELHTELKAAQKRIKELEGGS